MTKSGGGAFYGSINHGDLSRHGQTKFVDHEKHEIHEIHEIRHAILILSYDFDFLGGSAPLRETNGFFVVCELFHNKLKIFKI